MKFRVPYGKPVSAGAINFADALSKTQQSFKDECDINLIMARYRSTGVMPPPGRSPPVAQFGDFASAPDFMEAQNTLLRAQASFDSLPVKVRDRFNYDPVKFLEFLSDAKNADEAEALGLLSPEAVARRAAARAPPPPTPEGKS